MKTIFTSRTHWYWKVMVRNRKDRKWVSWYSTTAIYKQNTTQVEHQFVYDKIRTKNLKLRDEMQFYSTQTFITTDWWNNWAQRSKNNLKSNHLHSSPLRLKTCSTRTILSRWIEPPPHNKPLLLSLKNNLLDSNNRQKMFSLRNIKWKSSNKQCTKSSGTVLSKTLKQRKRKSLILLILSIKPQKSCRFILFNNLNHWPNLKGQALNYVLWKRLLLILVLHLLILNLSEKIEL